MMKNVSVNMLSRTVDYPYLVPLIFCWDLLEFSAKVLIFVMLLANKYLSMPIPGIEMWKVPFICFIGRIIAMFDTRASFWLLICMVRSP